MIGVSKVVPPKRQIIKDISLSFYPGAKIGLLGLNGAGKSTVLRIMAGTDKDYQGEARPEPGIKIGFLEQEPQLDPAKSVREVVEEGVSEIIGAQQRLDEIYAAYGEEGADFDKLAAEQQRLENLLAANDAHALERQLEVAADALRLPPWEAVIGKLSGGEKRRVALCQLLLQKPDMGTASGPRTTTSASAQAANSWSRCATSPRLRWRRLYSASSRVRCNQRWMMATPRGPACASSASHTRAPAGVPASSAARQASSASSSTPIGSSTTGKPGSRRASDASRVVTVSSAPG